MKFQPEKQLFFYVYRLTCTHPKSSQKYYYGSRGCSCLPEQDSRYWSSSFKVLNTRKHYGKTFFKKKILKVFPTREQALEYEAFLHKRFDVQNHPLFFNQINLNSMKFINEKPHSEQTKQKMSRFRKQYYKNMTAAERLTSTNKLYKFTPNDNKKGAKAYRKWYHTLSEKERHLFELKRREKQKQNSEWVVCPYCGKAGYDFALRFWHFENCKNAPHPSKKTQKLREFHAEQARELSKKNTKLRRKVTCPQCGKTGQEVAMKRWHFDTCKFAPKNTKGESISTEF